MKKLFLQKILLLLTVVIVCTYIPFSYAQEETGTVTGIVWGDSGPVVGAKVVISSSVISSYEDAVFTNADGYFSITGVPTGGEVHVVVYNDEDQVIGEGSGILSYDGETISVEIT